MFILNNKNTKLAKLSVFWLNFGHNKDRKDAEIVDLWAILCYNVHMKTIQKQGLFWDINLNDLDEKKHGDFITQRILERGDVEDLSWATETYGKDFIKNIFLKNLMKMDAKSQNFWCLYFNVNKSECINNQSTKKRSLFWKK